MLATAGRPQGLPLSPPPPAAEHQSAHASLMCVAAPHLAVSPEHGQLNGQGMEGVYHAGRRVIARCQLSIGGKEPIPLQGRMVSAWQARFVATARTTTDTGPDPEIIVERLRAADGTERITVRNAGPRAVRLPLELRFGTDLAEIAAIAVGRPGEELTAAVHGSGLAWTKAGLRARVTADPQPDSSWAQLGVLKWDWRLAPGTSRSVTLTAELARTPEPAARSGAQKPVKPSLVAARSARPPRLWHGVRATADDPRVGTLFRVCLDDANALLMSDSAAPSDLHLAAGVPWRAVLAPAESLRAARMLLPLGTRLAAGTLRTLSRGQLTGPGGEAGRLPGALRQAGPYAPPSCTGVEATLLLPTVLAEAWRWGLPENELQQLLPTARSALIWMLRAAEQHTYLPDPAPDGPYRCEVQAAAHRAAVLGAELLDECGEDGAPELKEWAAELRNRFREDFWEDDGGGGRPVAVRSSRGAGPVHLSSALAELLDTGLSAGGEPGTGLLAPDRTGQLVRLLTGPGLNSGWGLRSLDSRDSRYNPFGHRSGAVRVGESVTAASGCATSGFGREAAVLVRGLVDASARFGLRLPEMYAAEQRSRRGLPLPHPAACRPAAVAAAGGVRLLTLLAGVQPDAPAGLVRVSPPGPAPFGAVTFEGLRVGGRRFSVAVDADGTAEVLEVAEGVQVVN